MISRAYHRTKDACEIANSRYAGIGGALPESNA
jgi:hypothetical protein